MKLVYSDATRESCERADYNVPMAFTQNNSAASTLGPSPLASGAVLRLPTAGTNVPRLGPRLWGHRSSFAPSGEGPHESPKSFLALGRERF